ncbi:hypothetical protein EMCRGX_G001266 [Ephydatia muelleri]
MFLDPVSLCQASRVSKAWNAIANDPKLWMIHCRNLLLSAAGERKQRSLYVDPDGSVQWKEMYSERFRLRRNWLKGYCTVRTFEGHTQGISCVQFDETRIVTGSWDKTIKVWNRRTNTAWAALTLSGHSGTVQCLHLHKNRLVWDLSTDKVGWVGAACRATMVGHLHTVRCLQADDDRVISGSYDHTLKIWDIRSGHCNATLRGHTDAVLCLQFDGQRVVSGSKDTFIKVWDLPDGNCKLTLYGHQAAVTCVQFDERRIISGALDRLIKIWNICTGECIQTLDWIRSEGHTGVVRHLQADRWKIVSAADDKTMKVWSLDTGARLLTLRSHTDGVTCLQFNDEVIVSGSYDKTVKLWDFSVC